jgi:hypothetical protein
MDDDEGYDLQGGFCDGLCDCGAIDDEDPHPERRQ